MAASVDNRIVSMEFDNAQFERNVATSMESLKRLDESLNFKNAEKSFEDIEKASNNVKLSAISEALDKLNSHFSVWGIASRKIIEDITGLAEKAAKKMYDVTIGQISQGGWTRASNIEQAKFQLQGLGIAWDEVSDSINYAVDGTAYGLDSAAKAASQLAASGVELGQDMSDALRGISGVAAMTNSSYDDVANIFTTIAGNGRVMTMQLNQIGARGINAAAELAKAFGVTEAELREMVTKGKVSFNDFAKAMDDAFGEHAKDANKTFTGVMSNIRAALSRIGAEFATPILTEMVAPLNQLRDIVVSVKSALQPLFDIWKAFITNIAGPGLTSIGEFINQSNIIKNLVDGLLNIFSFLIQILVSVGIAFKNAFPDATLTNLAIWTSKFKDFTDKIMLTGDNMKNLSKTAEGLFSILGFIGDIISTIIYILSPLGQLIEPIVTAILSATGALGEWISVATKSITESEAFKTAVQIAHDAVDAFAKDVPGFISRLFSSIGPIITNIVGLFLMLKDKIAGYISQIDIDLGNFKLADIIGVVFEKAKSFISKFTSALPGEHKTIKSFFDGFQFPSFEQAVNFIIDRFNDLKGAIGKAVDYLGLANIDIGNIMSKLGDVLLKGRDYVLKFVSGITDVISIDEIAKIGIIVMLATLVRTINDSVTAITSAGTRLLNSITTMFQMPTFVVSEIGKTLQAFQQDLKAEAIERLAKAIATLAFSLAAVITAFSVMKENDLANAIATSIFFCGELLVLIAALGAVYVAVNKLTQTSMTGAFIKLSAGITLLCSSILIIFAMLEHDPKAFGVAMIEFADIVAIMVLAMAGMAALGNTAGLAATNAVLMAAAIDALIPALVSLTVLNTFGAKGMAAALFEIAIVLAEFLLVLTGLSLLNTTGVIAAAGAMVILASALDVMIPYFLTMALIDFWGLGDGLQTLTVVMLEFGIAMGVLSKVGEQCILVALAFDMFAAGIDILAAGMGIMAAVLSDHMVEVLVAFGLITVAVAGFIGTCYALEPVLPVVAAVDAALFALAAVFASAGAAALMIAASFYVMVEAVRNIIKAIDELDKVSRNLDENFSANVTKMLTGIIAAIRYSAPVAIDAFWEIIVKWLQGMKEAMPQIIEETTQIIIGISTGIIENAPRIIMAVNESINKVVGEIKEHTNDFHSSGNILIDALIIGINVMLDKIKIAIGNVIQAMKDKFIEVVHDFVELGKNVVTGIAQGIEENTGIPVTQMVTFANNLANKFAKVLKIKSPSQVFIDLATMICKGVGVGVTNSEGEASDAVIQLATKLEAVFGGIINEGNWEQYGAGIIAMTNSGIINSEDDLFNSSANAISQIAAGADSASGDVQESVNNVISLLNTSADGGNGFNIGALWSGNVADGVFSNFDAVRNATQGILSMLGIQQKAANVRAEYRKDIVEEQKSHNAGKTQKQIEDEVNAVIDKCKQQEALQKQLDSITKSTGKGGGGGSGGSGGGGGGGSSTAKTAQEVKELYDVLKDGAGVITAFQNRFVKLNETLDDTSDETANNAQAFEVAKGAVSALAEQLFVASDSYDETMAAMDKSSAEYLAGMKEAWDAYKESLESTLVGSVDAFSAFTQASHVSAEDILDNIYSEITGLEMFDETIRGLANSNINPTLLKDLVDGGIQNMDKLMGLLYATDQQRESISKAYETLTNVEANLTDKVMASLALSVDGYDKSIQETLANSEVFQEGMEKLSDNTQFTTSQIVVMFNETQQGLKEVIKSGMSYFDEYEKKQKVSKKELQKNLDDQKKAWEDWGDALNEVIAKGLDKSVVQNLMQMGVESMDKLQGFMDMTEDEIGHYNETVAEYIKIPDKLSAEIAANYTATALDVSNAFKDGIDSTKAEEAIAEMGNNLEQALKDAVGDKGSVQGSALSKSFDDGFKENAIYVYDTIKEFGQNVLDELEIDEGGIADIGENLMKSLAASIKDNSYLVVDALEEVTEEGKDTSEKGFGIGSPSKVFMDIGKFIDQGLAIGIRDNANDVTKQTKNLGNETYKAMDAVVGHILDILEGNEAFSPVITPVLDLDDVTNGMKDIRSMTGNFGVGYSFMQAQNAVNTVPTTQAGAYYNTPITINVYGNDDPDAVANAVQNKINHQIRRLGALG